MPCFALPSNFQPFCPLEFDADFTIFLWSEMGNGLVWNEVSFLHDEIIYFCSSLEKNLKALLNFRRA